MTPLARANGSIKLLLILLLAVLAGCGFQPRGQGQLHSLANLGNPIHIDGLTSYSPLYLAISKQLKQSGAQISEQAEGALRLRISQHKSTERVISVDSRKRAAEYELVESLYYTLERPGQVRPRAQQLRSVRFLFRPQSQVLAAGHEEQQMRAEMRQDLATRLVRRIAASQ